MTKTITINDSKNETISSFVVVGKADYLETVDKEKLSVCEEILSFLSAFDNPIEFILVVDNNGASTLFDSQANCLVSKKAS